MLSVIIPTRNRCELLGSALLSIGFQTLSKDRFEVLVVDNGSADDTRLIARRFSNAHYHIRYLREETPGLHAGRHKGLAAAQGNILVFADDDIEPNPLWLLSIDKAFSDPEVSMVGGNNIPIFIGPPPEWLYRLWSDSDNNGGRSISWLSIQEQPPGQRPCNPYMVWGCNFAIRKDVLQAAGGFHPDGMPQELIRFRGDGETHVSQYVAENNLKCIFDSGASVYHKVTPERMTLEYMHKRGFSQGVSASYTQLRRDGVMSAYRNKVSSITLTDRLRFSLGKLKKTLKHQLFAENPGITSFNAGYKEGFAYHQAVYQADQEVRDWVHKENYF